MYVWIIVGIIYFLYPNNILKKVNFIDLNRVFVLLPFCDIAPEAVHPLTGKTIQEHCTGLLNNYTGNLPVNTGINVSGFRDEF